MYVYSNDDDTNNSSTCVWCCHHDHIQRKSSPGSFDEYRQIAKSLPTLRPSQLIWAVSLPLRCRHSYPPSPFIIIQQLEG